MNRIEDVTDYITECDKEVGEALSLELGRQRRNLELIASENIVSPAVMLAMGTVPTNKYAEGYPGKRYYGGVKMWTFWSRKNGASDPLNVSNGIPHSQ